MPDPRGEQATPLPPGVKVHEDRTGRLLELPPGHAKAENWVLVVIGIALASLAGFAHIAHGEERLRALAVIAVALGVVLMAVSDMLTRTAVSVTRDAVTVERRGPFRHTTWRATRDEVSVGETLGRDRGRYYLVLFSEDDEIALMHGFPRAHVEAVRTLLESWTTGSATTG